MYAGQTDKKENKKSIRSITRSTFDSVIDDFIEDNFEKSSAFVVSMFMTFFIIFGLALIISLNYQSKKIAFQFCTKFPEWQFYRTVPAVGVMTGSSTCLSS